MAGRDLSRYRIMASYVLMVNGLETNYGGAEVVHAGTKHAGTPTLKWQRVTDPLLSHLVNLVSMLY